MITLLEVTANNNCVIFIVNASPNIMQISGKVKFYSFQYMCPMVSAFYFGLIST